MKIKTKEDLRIFFGFYLVKYDIKEIDMEIFDNEKQYKKIVEMINYFELVELRSGNVVFAGRKGTIELLRLILSESFLFRVPELFAWHMGHLCNIPTCCINNYIQHNMDDKRVVDDYQKKLNGRKDPFNIKWTKRGTTKKTLNYLPCSPDCKDSLKLLKVYKEFWDKMFEDFGIDKKEGGKL